MCIRDRVNGLMIRSISGVLDHVPLTFIPIRVRREDVEELQATQSIWQRALSSMASNPTWLLEKLIMPSQQDVFIRKLIEVYIESRKYPHRQSTQICIMRNDYLYDEVTTEWKQVEFNLFSPASGTAADKTHLIHHLFEKSRRYHPQTELLGYNKTYDVTRDLFILIFKEAFTRYGNKDAVVVFVVNQDEANETEQRCTEFDLLSRIRIRVLRLSFSEISKRSTIDGSTGAIAIDGYDVAIFYFRHGYVYEHYEEENAWEVRKMIEKSRAFKIPCVEYQLLNFKWFQFIIANPKELRQFVTDVSEGSRIQACFSEFWAFNSMEDAMSIRNMVTAHPGNYVLKPQKEGGGNNIFEEGIVKTIDKALKAKDISSLKQYILMKRMRSTPKLTAGLRNGKFVLFKGIAEVSFFSAFMSNDGKPPLQIDGGYLVRTKRYDAPEGGFSIGEAFSDSIVLV
eukprot:TRINITY_DN13568_c0_g1_i3.p1 TRINITY_DN13568_c0_g1~~TRINITY_DN13568_c0_g1_i3.p1  ORF type:complete len:483 (+),score=72.70 TRINITY_DN13568_c0_g1_i3:89-1450(+)